jgi:hypothetical protein
MLSIGTAVLDEPTELAAVDKSGYSIGRMIICSGKSKCSEKSDPQWLCLSQVPYCLPRN